MATGGYLLMRRNLNAAHERMNNLATGRHSDEGSRHHGFNRSSGSSSGGTVPAQPWEVSEEEWNALPDGDKALLQDQRDQYLFQQRRENDPLGIAREFLPEALNHAASGESSGNPLEASTETVQDYQSICALILKAIGKGQIPPHEMQDTTMRPLKHALHEINKPEVFAALGTTQEEFFEPLERAYLDRAEAELTIAAKMPAGSQTPEEAYRTRMHHYGNATDSYRLAANVRAISKNDPLSLDENHYAATLHEQGLSDEYLNDLQNQIYRDQKTQIRQQANLEGQHAETQHGHLNPEARGVPRPPEFN